MLVRVSHSGGHEYFVEIVEADGGITPIGCYLDRAKAERQAAALASLYQVGWETNYP